MSRAAVQAVIDFSRRDDCEWTPAEFRLMVNLAEHENGTTGRLCPGERRLAEECHTSRPHLRRMLDQREAAGDLERLGTGRRGRLPGGRYPSESYRITLRGTRAVPLTTAQEVPPGSGSGTTTVPQEVPPRSRNLGFEPGRNRARGDGSTPDGAAAARPGQQRRGGPSPHGRNAGHADDRDNCPACGTGRAEDDGQGRPAVALAEAVGA